MCQGEDTSYASVRHSVPWSILAFQVNSVPRGEDLVCIYWAHRLIEEFGTSCDNVLR